MVFIFMGTICLPAVSADNENMFIGKISLLQFHCHDFDSGKIHDVYCDGKVDVKSEQGKLKTIQVSWNPKKENPQWFYSTKELIFYIEQLAHTTEYGLERLPAEK